MGFLSVEKVSVKITEVHRISPGIEKVDRGKFPSVSLKSRACGLPTELNLEDPEQS